MSDRWQFWIDVGGTFTDCLARRPDGSLARHKLLSSGVTKGNVGHGSTSRAIADPRRSLDPDGFWCGAKLRLLDATGRVVAAKTVVKFIAAYGALILDSDLPENAPIGHAYELVADAEAPILAIRWLLGLAAGEPLPPLSLRLGTTRGTNALLTRSGARTGFITTRGFADILRIGYQNRPRLFELNIVKPQSLFESVVEIDERVAADGRVLQSPNPQAVREQLIALRQTGVESLAICLLNGYQFAAHEELVERIAREVGFDEISVSSRIAPLIKLVSRGDTTVVDAYLNPVLREYVAALRQSLHHVATDFRLLTSAGGLVTAENFVGKDSILSGPAGGVVGFAAVAEAAGFTRAIGFDMGGTSTDVARWDGRFEREYETEKAGVRIVAPMMAIETVAAGGGSLCWFDGVKLCVGPASAGASPGPACYGNGGPLAITDVNLALGKILPQHFPFHLDRSAVDERLQQLSAEIFAATGQKLELLELAAGFVRVANARMAQAIRSVSIAKGCDVRDYVLVAFGGAAGQHACAIARELGITQILNHPDAGILSAYGIGMANVEHYQVEGIYRLFDEQSRADLPTIFERLSHGVKSQVAAEGIAATSISVELALDLRYRGLDAFLTITQPADGDWAAAYAREHEKLYGYTHVDKPLEIVAARATAVGQSGIRPPAAPRVQPRTTPTPLSNSPVYIGGQNVIAPVFDRERLRPGDVVVGPAIVVERVATTIIDPGWEADVLSDGQLLLRGVSLQTCPSSVNDSGRSGDLPHEADPILLEIFNNHFAAIASQMGITLRNTASSVNVKERLDFSCAVFTRHGDLVVNAPHIPVHLGAMGLTVRSILADNPHMRPGDVFVTNDPYRGGSHLPDLTVVTPVFAPWGRSLDLPELLFFTASRAHHAEIGGIRAGSMPPFSKNLAEEGVLIRNFKIVDAGRSRIDDFRELLTTAKHPTRNVADNLADISAQIAANRQGARDLLALVERYTQPVVAAYMQHIQAAAEQKTRRALAQLPAGRREFVDHLDDGSPIRVAVTIAGERATIDFTGTGPVLAGNLNANRAIVTAAVMYVLRCLIDEDIPLNEGVLAPVEIVLPECLLNPPAHERAEDCAAIVGGNVETSQRVVDVLLGALGLAAASQGTMNNLLFGDASFGYYETIGGGAGATATAAGADAVHTHMTNTRLTDPEVLERRYGVRLHQFSIRRGSGGAGKHRGGDGIVRRIEFLKPLDVSIVSQRRKPYAPYGVAGGEAGALGENRLVRADGTTETFSGQAQFAAQAGDVLTIATPGGGGWGAT